MEEIPDYCSRKADWRQMIRLLLQKCTLMSRTCEPLTFPSGDTYIFFVYIFTSLCGYMSLCPSTYIPSTSIYLPFVFNFMPIHWSIFLFVISLSIHWSIYISICLLVYLSVLPRDIITHFLSLLLSFTFVLRLQVCQIVTSLLNSNFKY